MVLQGFIKWTRQGTFGCRKQVQTGSVQAALCAVAKKIELAGHPNPLHKPGTTIYHAALAMQTEAYKQEDPAMVKLLAVPVTIPNHAYKQTRSGRDLSPKGSWQTDAHCLLLLTMSWQIYVSQQRQMYPVPYDRFYQASVDLHSLHSTM